MKLLYKNMDIYSQIQLKECIYESNCCNRLNYLRILFEDDTHKFDSFGMQINDEISILTGEINTGKMFVNEIRPVSNGYEIIAKSAQAESWNVFHSKKWNKVHFKQIMQDIAEWHGMDCEFYGIKDAIFNEKEQQGVKDFAFAAQIAMLEGCILVFYNNKLIVSSEQYLESQDANSSIEIDSGDIYISKKVVYSSCLVTDGNITGIYKIDEGNLSIQKNFFKFEDKGMAERYAKNILRYQNKDAYRGTITINDMIDIYSAGSVVEIISSEYMSANGKAFIYRIRNDIVQGKTKIWFRKCLEY